MPLDRASDRPLYRQLTEHLGGRLLGEFQPGDRLPSEAELAAEYDVNRLTVRQALADLIRAGLVDTIQGKGSFVAEPPLRYDVPAGSDASFTRAMRVAGRTVAQQLLAYDRDPDPAVGRELRTRRPVHRFRLLRRVDGVAWSVTTTWLSRARFPKLAEHWQGDTSLFELLEDRYGLRTVRSERTFAAEPADVNDAELLAVPVGSPILTVRGRNVTDDGDPVALVQHRFRGDRVQFSLGLR